MPHASRHRAPLAAFLWDYDGTLVDTRRRNYTIVRRLLAEATGRPADRFPALRSLEIYEQTQRRYVNWRDLYTREFGLSDADTDRLGSLWSDYQLRDDTPAELFAGIADVLAALAGVPHGVVSQNARTQITRSLERAGIARYFRSVIGYDSVHIQRQKPEPDGLLACLDELAIAGPARVVYVGDHETDVRCARRAARVLADRANPIEVLSIAVCFGDGCDHEVWDAQADYVVRTPGEIPAVALELGLEP
ncbi:MAG: HAD family hydrolase [Gemmatimonadota bacterium]|nr:HAD family hydrolase [Gemmatimonadota bacterium]